MRDEKPVPETLESIGAQIRTLAAATDERFAQVDKRFDDVTDALVEQRKYTEFAFERLQAEILTVKTGLAVIDRKLDRALDHVNRKLDRVLVHVDRKLDRVLVEVDRKLDRVLVDVDRKLDRVLDHVTRRPPPRRRRS